LKGSALLYYGSQTFTSLGNEYFLLRQQQFQPTQTRCMPKTLATQHHIYLSSSGRPIKGHQDHSSPATFFKKILLSTVTWHCLIKQHTRKSHYFPSSEASPLLCAAAAEVP
jgi:hypothetical protein